MRLADGPPRPPRAHTPAVRALSRRGQLAAHPATSASMSNAPHLPSRWRQLRAVVRASEVMQAGLHASRAALSGKRHRLAPADGLRSDDRSEGGNTIGRLPRKTRGSFGVLYCGGVAPVHEELKQACTSRWRVYFKAESFEW